METADVNFWDVCVLWGPGSSQVPSQSQQCLSRTLSWCWDRTGVGGANFPLEQVLSCPSAWTAPGETEAGQGRAGQ